MFDIQIFPYLIDRRKKALHNKLINLFISVFGVTLFIKLMILFRLVSIKM